MSSDQNTNQSSEQPSMIGAHVKYAQGAISSMVGYETGEQTKKEAVQEMREANAQNPSEPTQNNALGTAENLAGKAFGCEGMEKEGSERKTNKAGLEETSGTG